MDVEIECDQLRPMPPKGVNDFVLSLSNSVRIRNNTRSILTGYGEALTDQKGNLNDRF